MTDRGTIGSIIEVTSDDGFYWKVPNLQTLSEAEGDFYWSPEVQLPENVWKLCIYPKGTTSIPGWTLFQVWRTNISAVKPVRFSLSVYKNKDSLKEIVDSERFDLDTCYSSGLFKFLPRSVLVEKWDEFTYHRKLNVMFVIWIDEPASVEGIKLNPAEPKVKELTTISAGAEDDSCHDTKRIKLNPAVPKVKELTAISAGAEDDSCHDAKGDDPTFRQHLEDMLLTGDDHDVTIKVGDQLFRAHKCMLRVRSSVFAAMFKHKLKESSEDSISIDDCDPESFGEFLQCLYTGRVKNLSLSNAMGLYYAGDKYDIPGLKKACVEFLKASLSTTVIGDVISLAVKHGEDELLKCATEFFANHMEEIMTTVEWKLFLLDNPIRANELCLKAVRTSYKKMKYF